MFRLPFNFLFTLIILSLFNLSLFLINRPDPILVLRTYLIYKYHKSLAFILDLSLAKKLSHALPLSFSVHLSLDFLVWLFLLFPGKTPCGRPPFSLRLPRMPSVHAVSVAPSTLPGAPSLFHLAPLPWDPCPLPPPPCHGNRKPPFPSPPCRRTLGPSLPPPPPCHGTLDPSPPPSSAPRLSPPPPFNGGAAV